MIKRMMIEVIKIIVIAAMIHYKNETATIKDIVKVTRNKRLQCIKEPFI